MATPSPLAMFIAQRRSELNLTQAELSEKLNDQGFFRAAATIATWETGKQPIPLEVLPQLALALETSLATLYKLAGAFRTLPGAEVLEIIEKLPEKERKRLIALIRVYAEQNLDE